MRVLTVINSIALLLHGSLQTGVYAVNPTATQEPHTINAPKTVVLYVIILHQQLKMSHYAFSQTI